MPLGQIILIVLIALSIGSLFGFEALRARRAKKARLESLSSRPSSDVLEWYRTHFENRGISFQAARTMAELLGKTLGCRPTSFRPADSFSRELSVQHASITGLDVDDEMETFHEETLAGFLDDDSCEDFERNAEKINTFEDLALWYDGRITKSQRAAIRFPQFCSQCDYNLTGLIEPRCPECGTPFPAETLLHQQ